MAAKDRILGPISLLDCLVFLVFLTPSLLLQVGLFNTLYFILTALPFLALRMPIQLIHERYFLAPAQRSPFARQASLFQDIVIRCVRYAFANMPASIGAVFFSKSVSLPFMRFRQIRHGHLRSLVHYEEISRPGMKGVWIVADPQSEPDVVVLYCHGGGFAMGSAYFYLEFLMTLVVLMQERGQWKNPAVLAVEYTLVPKATFPTQLHEVRAGYECAVEQVMGRDARRVCVAGDSAGATLVLSLLLSLAKDADAKMRPGFATLISPWCTLVSWKDRDTPSDFLNADSLHLYAKQYVGSVSADGTIEKGRRPTPVDDPLASPGSCKDLELWKKASPENGHHFIYGAEEVFAPAAKELIKRIRSTGSNVDVSEADGAVHAWPVVSLFLKDTRQDRLEGLYDIVDTMSRRMTR